MSRCEGESLKVPLGFSLRVQPLSGHQVTGPASRLAIMRTVPVSKSRNIPEVVLVRRWAVGVLGIWRGGVGWVKGGANRVSLQAT